MSLWEAVGRAGTALLIVWGTSWALSTFGVDEGLAFALGLMLGFAGTVFYSRYIWRSGGERPFDGHW